MASGRQGRTKEGPTARRLSTVDLSSVEDRVCIVHYTQAQLIASRISSIFILLHTTECVDFTLLVMLHYSSSLLLLGCWDCIVVFLLVLTVINIAENTTLDVDLILNACTSLKRTLPIYYKFKRVERY